MPEDGGRAGEAVVFVVPEGRPPSGGDLYNRFLLQGLRKLGCRFERTTLAAFRARTWPPGTEAWVDSLYIPDLAAAGPVLLDARPYFIIHSLPSADPGLAPEEAGRLREAEDLLLPRAAGFLVTGAAAAGALRDRGLAAPILRVPPAPCVLPSGPLRPPPVFSGLIVSSLIRGKGVPDFLAEFGREVRAGDAFRIRIAGRTDIEPRTAAAALEAVSAHPLLRDRIVHLGFVPNEDLGREYERSSALISPSSIETFGMAFHDARAFGLPLLAVRAAYSEPLVEPGWTGLLFGSAAELAEGVLGLVRDPERARRLAASAASARPAATSTWTGAARSFLSQRAGYGIVSSRS